MDFGSVSDVARSEGRFSELVRFGAGSTLSQLAAHFATDKSEAGKFVADRFEAANISQLIHTRR